MLHKVYYEEFMMEFFVLGLFVASLLGCILLDVSILIALMIGFVLFFGYGLVKGFSFPEMVRMSLNGVNTVKSILITFLLIGMLTASWRGSGTIAVIICYFSWMIRPAVFLLVSFLLNSLVSFLTGTSFGTVATVGVICMTMGTTMQINPVLAGGSILSGIFFGDRCSPVSTSALLVSQLTGTDIYQNIKKMMEYAVVPFSLSCLIYLVLGFTCSHGEGNMEVWALFSSVFRIHWMALLPAAVILVLSLFRVKVKATMLVSILVAVVVCLLIQKLPFVEVLKALLLGYKAADPAVASMLNGGGVVSMLRVSAIVCLSSSYSGIFAGTHMLDGIRSRIASLGERMSPFAGILGVSIFTSAISCNQTLSIMLTNQLCEKLEPDKEKMMICLEDAPVVVAPLIPWSIAGAVPVSTIGAPGICLLAACYLYLVPIWHLVKAGRER